MLILYLNPLRSCIELYGHAKAVVLTRTTLITAVTQTRTPVINNTTRVLRIFRVRVNMVSVRLVVIAHWLIAHLIAIAINYCILSDLSAFQ